ncbi:CYTH domain-containing protein [Bacillus timonensis]|nr:CYTH domain-containing protein [Bacillus timonensis]
MTQEIEIEFKNLLSKDEYRFLIKSFAISHDKFIEQENHYFDTPQFSLKNQHSALRIRLKGNTYTLTLKQPIKDGLLETHQTLSNSQAESMLTGGELIDGQIKNILLTLNIETKEITYFGSLKTNRVQFPYKSGLLVLDHSKYLGNEDFEVEFEVNDYKLGEKEFHDFLSSYSIPIRETKNKIQRFYLQKYLHNGEKT